MGKLFSYIKFLVCIVLILSFVMPLYAIGTYTDGNAFITKEEFDKALSDFNARLTMFEGGINSKIDNQVSSYLNRNGIWNGKKQTFLNYALINNFYDNFTFETVGDENIMKAWYIPELVASSDWSEGIDLSIKAVNAPLTVGGGAMEAAIATPSPGSYTATVKIIDNVDKSGLLFLNWLARDTARMNAKITNTDTSARQGSWIYNVRYHQGSLSNFTNQSKYNQLKADWQKPLHQIAALGTGASSLSGWGATVAPSVTNAWSSFSLSESVKFHTGYDPDLTGLDAVTNLKSEQLLWNYTLQYSFPTLFAYPTYWPYAQYRLSILGDATQYMNLFFVNKGDSVYATIVFTISGRTPQDAVRFVTANTNGHFAGTAFMLSADVY